MRLLLLLPFLCLFSCQKEDTESVQTPDETIPVTIDTIYLHSLGNYVDTTDSRIIVKNTGSSSYDLLHHRITVGYKAQAATGGIVWFESKTIPSNGELVIYPEDVDMLFFEDTESNKFFAKFYDKNDEQFQEYITE